MVEMVVVGEAEVEWVAEVAEEAGTADRAKEVAAMVEGAREAALVEVVAVVVVAVVVVGWA